MILDDFAGPGGWDEGLRMIGATDTVGTEWDDAACQTAIAAGFQRIQVDVATHSCDGFRGLRAYVGSPPCTFFSTAGKGTGRAALGLLADGVRRMFAGEDCREEIREAVYREYALPAREAENADRKPDKQWTAERVVAKAREDAYTTVLVLEPARRIMALRPSTIALEQVPQVLPLWRVYAYELRRLGYSVWAGVLCAADYGVPQTRRRAILMASTEQAVHPPKATHAEHPDPEDLFGDALLPWISMSDALGWGFDDEPAATISSGGASSGGAEPFANSGYRKRLASYVVDRRTNSRGADGMYPTPPVSDDRPAPTITGNTKLWLRMGNQANSPVRHVDEPAPTVVMGHRSNDVRWFDERPATTVLADPRVGRPGHKDREGGEAQFGQDSVRITVQEAATLQSFPADHPWHGTQSKQFEQVGNAVPPLLAAHIGQALGLGTLTHQEAA